MLFTDLFESFTGAESLNIGDPVIITGNVKFQGKTGDIAGFGRDNRFVIVDLYNHGKQSFQSSDVEYNEYADQESGEENDYDTFGDDERDEDLNEGFGAYYYEQLAQKMFDQNPNFSTKGRADELLNAAFPVAVQDLGKKRAQWEFGYDEDFPSDFVSAYAYLQGNQGVAEDTVDDFLARGGEIQHVKAQKGPKHPGLSLASKHIGGGGDKMKASRTGRGSKPQGKPVVATETSLNEGPDTDQLAGMIAARLERLAPNVFTDYGVEFVLEAVRDVAEFYAMSDFEEIGTSDLGAMARSVVKQLKQREAYMNKGV